jgi:uncharacterized membrane protein YbhN (UPF0104 family)
MSEAGATIAAEAPSLPRGRLVSTFLKIALTVALLVALSMQIEWRRVGEEILRLRGVEAWFALLLWVPTQGLQYLRWKMFASRAGNVADKSDYAASYWLGHTLGLITPGRIGAFGRALFLRGVPLSRAAGVTILERTYAAISVNGMGLIALGVLPSFGWAADWAIWDAGVNVLLIAVGSLFLVAGLVPAWIAGLMQRLMLQFGSLQRMARVFEAMREVNLLAGSVYLLISAATLVVPLLQFVLILRGFGIDVAWFAGMLAVSLNFFLKGNIPLTMGNLGIGEWTALLCLRGLGVPEASAVAASLLLFLINVAAPAAIGMLYLNRLSSDLWQRKGTS